MIINVKVKPNSKKDNLNKISEKSYEARIKSKAEKGKANLALIKLIAKYFNVLSSQVKIRLGFTSHNKIIEIVN